MNHTRHALFATCLLLAVAACAEDSSSDGPIETTGTDGAETSSTGDPDTDTATQGETDGAGTGSGETDDAGNTGSDATSSTGGGGTGTSAGSTGEDGSSSTGGPSGVEYSAAVHPDGSLRIFAADFDLDICTRVIVLTTPGNTYDIIPPEPFGTVAVIVRPDALRCGIDDGAPQAADVESADGEIRWDEPPVAPSIYPCAIAIDAQVSIGPGSDWAPSEVDLSGSAIPVEGC